MVSHALAKWVSGKRQKSLLLNGLRTLDALIFADSVVYIAPTRALKNAYTLPVAFQPEPDPSSAFKVGYDI